MKYSRTILILLIFTVLLSGCSALENMPKPPKVTTVPAETEIPLPSPTVSTAPQETAVSEPETEELTHEQTEIENAAPSHGMLIHVNRTEKEAFDPAEGTKRILSFSWDSVRVDSTENPTAAARITEELAALQDAWYTGNGSSEYDIYGYNDMLAAAEDNYSVFRDYGGELAECSATRYVTVLRADEEICIFLVDTYVFLGGVHGSYATEAICFDAKTGARLTISSLTADEQGLRTALLQEMLHLAEEDADGYYTDQLSLIEPSEYETAFSALMRDGSWYLDEDGFHLFSDLYELGPYATGITDFLIPYDRLTGLLDARWIPKAAETTAAARLMQLEELTENGIEIVDRVAVGDGGEACLIAFEGDARNVEICSAYFADRFYPDGEMFFCGQMRDCALQLSLLFPGDMPETMLRYRDAAGEHEYMITLSGKDGSIILVENR